MGRPAGSKNKPKTTTATTKTKVEDKKVEEPIVETEKVEEIIEEVKEDNKLQEENAMLMNTIAMMQEQMKTMQMQMNNNNAKAEPKKLTAKKVKVVSLIDNTLNLSTLGFGKGRPFTFNGFGSSKTIRLSDLEDILSIDAYRKQAEAGLFYICDEEIVEEFDLSDEYKEINDKKAIEHILTLSDDSCVEMFCGMGEKMQESLSTTMAEKIAEGRSLDRNRLADIQRITDIDIEGKARDIKRMNDKKQEQSK